MKRKLVSLLTIFLVACSSQESTPHAQMLTNTPTQPASPTLTETTTTPLPSYNTPPNTNWHIQYTGEINPNLNVGIYNIDLFDTPVSLIAELRARNIFVMCYFSAGSFEDWRPDISQFPGSVLGNPLEGWQGEAWLDIRQIHVLAPIMQARLQLASQKGCHGIDPDNVNGYTNDTGFPLTYQHQLTYNIWLADAAHALGLSIGLKNDLEQIPDLVTYFDWLLNEECFSYQECELLLPFITAAKPVFQIEYELPTSEFCEQALRYGFQSLQKNWELDSFSESCS